MFHIPMVISLVFVSLVVEEQVYESGKFGSDATQDFLITLVVSSDLSSVPQCAAVSCDYPSGVQARSTPCSFGQTSVLFLHNVEEEAPIGVASSRGLRSRVRALRHRSLQKKIHRWENRRTPFFQRFERRRWSHAVKH